MGRAVALSLIRAVTVLPLVIGGCNSDDKQTADAIRLFAAAWMCPRAVPLLLERNNTAEEAPPTMTLADAQLPLDNPGTSGVGTSDTGAAAHFHAFSDVLDTELTYEGTYTNDANGLVVDADGWGFTDGIQRSVHIEFDSQDEDGTVSGTITIVRGGLTYQAPIEMEPYTGDWPVAACAARLHLTRTAAESGRLRGGRRATSSGSRSHGPRIAGVRIEGCTAGVARKGRAAPAVQPITTANGGVSWVVPSLRCCFASPLRPPS